MAQFKVFANPVPRARRAYPYVVVLQAGVAQSGRDRAVAPAAPRAAFGAIPGCLTPVVTIEDEDFVLLVTSLTTLPGKSLGAAVASLAERREDIWPQSTICSSGFEQPLERDTTRSPKPSLRRTKLSPGEVETAAARRRAPRGFVSRG
jgi:hypothetical protein